MESSPNSPQAPVADGRVILALLLFFPLGLFWMWTRTNWSQQAKLAVSGVFALVLVGGMMYENSPAGKAERAAEEREQAQLVAAEKQRTADEAAKKTAAAEQAKHEYATDGLVLLLPSLKIVRTKGLPYVAGIVENRSGGDQYVSSVEFRVTNAKGRRVGAAQASVEGLKAGEKWEFKAAIEDYDNRWKSNADIPHDGLKSIEVGRLTAVKHYTK